MKDYKQKIDKICNLNCKEKDNKFKLDKLFSDTMFKIVGKYYVDISCDGMLSILQKFSDKYKIHLGYIFFGKGAFKDGYTGTMIYDNFLLFCRIYASTLDEMLKKAILCAYLYKKIKEKKED